MGGIALILGVHMCPSSGILLLQLRTRNPYDSSQGSMTDSGGQCDLEIIDPTQHHKYSES